MAYKILFVMRTCVQYCSQIVYSLWSKTNIKFEWSTSKQKHIKF